MQEPFENDEEPFEDLHTENEIKKIKLALEHGMDLSNSFAGDDLPPEVEGQFLDYMQQWEDQFAQHKMITIFDLAEQPEYKPLADLREEEIEGELNRILDLLRGHSIMLDTLCPVPDRELYRFVTEELMNKETNDIRIEGMMHCFTYEEYYPNHEYDIKNRCTELVEYITGKEKTGEPWGLADTIWIGDKELAKEELNKKITNFKDSFSSFTLHDFHYTVVIINDDKDKAEAVAHIRYTGVIDGSTETMEFEGGCRFWLTCMHEWWTIHKMELPWG